MTIPQIDFANTDSPDNVHVSSLTKNVDDAMSGIGFLTATNLGIDQAMLDSVFAASRAFFCSSLCKKRKYGYLSATDNFGYQALCEENLDPHRPADLKESFDMRDLLNIERSADRWPSAQFRELMKEFFGACMVASSRVQCVLSQALGLQCDYFSKMHNGENITLRLLRYPSSGVDRVAEQQMGAAAHTDYGLITLLFQDNVGGLEVLDGENQWHHVGCREGSVIINSGDLLERWTNGRYRSTPHRVASKIGERDRYSIAFFVDPDSDTTVSALDSCVTDGDLPKYAPISAGEFVQQRLEASHQGRFEP